MRTMLDGFAVIDSRLSIHPIGRQKSLRRDYTREGWGCQACSVVSCFSISFPLKRRNLAMPPCRLAPPSPLPPQGGQGRAPLPNGGLYKAQDKRCARVKRAKQLAGTPRLQAATKYYGTGHGLNPWPGTTKNVRMRGTGGLAGGVQYRWPDPDNTFSLHDPYVGARLPRRESAARRIGGKGVRPFGIARPLPTAHAVGYCYAAPAGSAPRSCASSIQRNLHGFSVRWAGARLPRRKSANAWPNHFWDVTKHSRTRRRGRRLMALILTGS